MDRRTFLQASLAGLLSDNCSCARAATLHGCRVAKAAAGDAPKIRLLDLLDPKYSYDWSLWYNNLWGHLLFNTYFDAKAYVVLYDDGQAPNALASPDVNHPGFSDGTVYLGVNLFQQLYMRFVEGDAFTPHAIIAHEYGHIAQYQRGMSSEEGPWQMEPHADFMAGWFLEFLFRRESFFFPHPKVPEREGSLQPDERVERAVRSFFELGDVAFNDPRHHGEPEFRAAMVRAGFESGLLRLIVSEAFEKGKKFAGLN